MKLKTFNSLNSSRVVYSKPAMQISSKSGQISFTASAVADFGCDTVALMQDEDKPTDWYISLSASEDAFKLVKLKSNQGDNGSLRFTSSFLVKEIQSSLSLSDIKQPIKFLLGEKFESDGQILIPIITRNPIHSN